MSEDRRQNPTSDIWHLKSELRRQMETRRAEYFAQNKNASFDLRDHFLKDIILFPGCVVSSYRAHGSEIDPAPLTDALHKAGHVIALPAMEGKGKSLAFRRYNPGDALSPNALGIEEPGVAAPLAEPDVLLVPLLAFDRSGARLGAGGGYYDRTIAELRAKKRVLTIGIGFSCQEISTIPTDSHDAILDRIATDKQVF